jgi:ribosome-binding factor A
MARVNEVLREVLADALEEEAGTDPRLELMTVTAVECDPDLRHATVLMASLPDAAREALAEVRPRLQAAIAHQVRIKRTPLLTFQADPAVAYGETVESILRGLRAQGELSGDDEEAAEVSTGEDQVLTAEDDVATGEDDVATGEDHVATGEDHVATGDDHVASAGDEDGGDRASGDASGQDGPEQS